MDRGAKKDRAVEFQKYPSGDDRPQYGDASAVGKGPKRVADQHQTRFGGDTGGQQHHFNSSMRATFFS